MCTLFSYSVYDIHQFFLRIEVAFFLTSNLNKFKSHCFFSLTNWFHQFYQRNRDEKLFLTRKNYLNIKDLLISPMLLLNKQNSSFKAGEEIIEVEKVSIKASLYMHYNLYITMKTSFLMLPCALFPQKFKCTL